MLTKKTKKWLEKNVPISLENKCVVITGANSGIGYKTAETCLFLGANIVMACRNIDKANQAKENLKKEYPTANISVMKLDLASFLSIDTFVQKIVDEQLDIDVFVNNAGVFRQPNKCTNDGLEMVLGVNYFGTYYLTEKIMPYLQELPHQVIYTNTISMIHKFAKKIDYNDFFYTKKYSNLAVYTRSKICLAKYTYNLSQKCENTNVKVYMTHPGIAITPLGLNAISPKIAPLSKPLKWVFNSPEKSSLSIAYILANNLPNGCIVGPNKLLGGWGYPKPNRIYKKVKIGAKELIDFTQKEIANHKR